MASEANLLSPTARNRLMSRAEPYFRSLEQGLAIGYRRGRKASVWLARLRDNQSGAYQEIKIGLADDHMAADGLAVFSFDQAQRQARTVMTQEAARRTLGSAEGAEKKTVSDVLDAYVTGYTTGSARRTEAPGRDVVNTVSIIKLHIRPKLGHIRLDQLSTGSLKLFKEGLVTAPKLGRTGVPSKAPVINPDVSSAERLRKRRARANRVMTPLRAALNHAFRQGWIVTDAAWRIALRPFADVDGISTRFLSLDQCEQLQKHADADFAVLVRAALLTGCRYGSLRFLRPKDINLAAKSALVRTTKSGTPQTIHLTMAGVAFLQRVTEGRKPQDFVFVRTNGEQWRPSDQSRRMAQACKATEITPAFTFHELRDTFASHLVMNGVPILTVSKLLGHADTRITEKHYAHLAPSHFHDVLEKWLPGF